VRVDVAACTRSPGLTSRLVTTQSYGVTMSYCKSAWSLFASALGIANPAPFGRNIKIVHVVTGVPRGAHLLDRIANPAP
jgi:hypothetical protein